MGFEPTTPTLARLWPLFAGMRRCSSSWANSVTCLICCAPVIAAVRPQSLEICTQIYTQAFLQWIKARAAPHS